MNTGDRKNVIFKMMQTGLLLLLIFSILLPYIYIVSEQDHECHEERCLICENIARCYDIISDIGKTAVYIFVSAALFSVLNHSFQKQLIRPVALFISRPRVRMNN